MFQAHSACSDLIENLAECDVSVISALLKPKPSFVIVLGVSASALDY
jgi:hypothetical protein